MPIRTLAPLLVNQIAAGEVIERPASVVKELVENSLDAGATRIEVIVADGGRQLVRISDNGAGIVADELMLAVSPHATSKLAEPDELSAITTLGFRGEALASIASISRLRLTSRATANGGPVEAGGVIDAQGESVSDPAPAPCAPGTIVEVRDLFFNTPARRKFMRSASAEFGHVADTITRMALAWPQVAFALTHNDRKTLDLPPNQPRRQRCVQLLGKELDEALLEFESNLPGTSPIQVWGLAGNPAIARSTGKLQYVYLNGRPVRDRNITHAIREAYRGLIPHDRQPVAVVMLDLDPATVDVNVHPTKAEVHFGDPGRVHGLVLSAIRQRLLGSDLTPTAALPTETTSQSVLDVAPPASGDRAATATSGHVTTSEFVDYFRRMDPTQKGFAYQEVKRALVEEAPDAVESDDDAAPSMTARLTEQRVLQVHNSYLVTQDEQGLLIVDQHALHERIMFETLHQRVLGDGKSLESQRMLTPATLAASPQRMAALEQVQPLLERIGIEAAPMGPQTIAIHAFASFLFDRNVDPIDFVEELLQRTEDDELGPAPAENGQTQQEAVLHKVLDMMACKAAVKAGDRMTPQELTELIARKDEIERSSNCPHGRPTTVRLTLRDLEKHFKRT